MFSLGSLLYPDLITRPWSDLAIVDSFGFIRLVSRWIPGLNPDLDIDLIPDGVHRPSLLLLGP